MKKRTRPTTKRIRKQQLGVIGDETFRIHANVVCVPKEEICPDPDQPRKYFEEAGIGDLANSLFAHGQLTPIWIRLLKKPVGKARYAIIEGERRWRAASRVSKITDMNCIIFDVDDEARIRELQIIANSNREPLTIKENCIALQQLRNRGTKPSDLIKIFGKSLPWIYQHLSLADGLLPEVFEFLGPPTDEKKRISFTTALLLIGVEEKIQFEIAKAISDGSMTMAEAKAYIRKTVVEKTGKSGITRPKREFEILFGHARRFERWLDTTYGTNAIQLEEILAGVLPESRKDFFDHLVELSLKCTRLLNTLKEIKVKERKRG